MRDVLFLGIHGDRFRDSIAWRNVITAFDTAYDAEYEEAEEKRKEIDKALKTAEAEKTKLEAEGDDTDESEDEGDTAVGGN